MNPGPTGERAPENELGVGSFVDMLLRWEAVGAVLCVLAAVVALALLLVG
jgi:hypothetical protein